MSNQLTIEWRESQNGNFVLFEGEGTIAATVFKNKYSSWQIIINSQFVGKLVANEYFDDAEMAKLRAVKIFNGADCTYLSIKNKV